jgi:hypothetical protein
LPMSLRELRDRITHSLQTITEDMLHRAIFCKTYPNLAAFSSSENFLPLYLYYFHYYCNNNFRRVN